MKRLIEIEWLKLKNYKVFWILTILYAVVLTAVCSGGMLFLQYLANQGAEIRGIDPTILPLYDFPDVWQNITYIATFLKIIPAFIIIISITNEYSYKTLRQNIIDGMSKQDFILSKLLLIGIFAFLNTILLLVIGSTTGLIYSHVQGIDLMLEHTEFLLAYFLDLLTFFSFALLVGLLLRKAGFAIILLGIYSLFVEPFLTIYLNFKFPDYSFYEFFPIRAINNLIRVPFPRYIFREIQDYVSFIDVFVVLAFLLFFISASYFFLKKKDVG
ncbi:ABC transporter permease [Flammeovirgaceae bacterium SG7u.111]|nr:ABC transporter permease [Flammeovirgaceae bacterium SG7u.132]WPO38179.1 ABC transporter permease [Flammeovirgaceae bacterium SG7u.111]